MTRPIQIAVFLLGVVCSLSYLNGAQGDTHFYVEGHVYCDTCRAQFVTRLSTDLKGAKVVVECRETENATEKFSAEAESDEKGNYKLRVDGEYEDDICEVSLLSSPDPDCSEIYSDGFKKSTSRIALTANNGMKGLTREANPLGFMRKDPLPECFQVYKEMELPVPFGIRSPLNS